MKLPKVVLLVKLPKVALLATLHRMNCGMLFARTIPTARHQLTSVQKRQAQQKGTVLRHVQQRPIVRMATGAVT